MQNAESLLTPLQKQVLAAARTLTDEGKREFHGYRITRLLNPNPAGAPKGATAKAYRALKRLQQLNVISGRWETDTELGDESRPRRYLYRLAEPVSGNAKTQPGQ